MYANNRRARVSIKHPFPSRVRLPRNAHTLLDSSYISEGAALLRLLRARNLSWIMIIKSTTYDISLSETARKRDE